MFDAIIVVCVMGLNPPCITLKDTKDTPKTEEACKVRVEEMAQDMGRLIVQNYPGRPFKIATVCKNSDPEA